MNKKDVLQHLSRSTSPNDCCTSVDSSFAVPSKAQPVSTCLDTLSRKIFSSSSNGATLEERVVLDGSSSTSNTGVCAYKRKKSSPPVAGNIVSDRDQAHPVSTCLDTLSRKPFSSSTNGSTLEEQVVLDCSSSTSNAGVFAYQRKKKVEPAGNWEYCF